MNIYLAGLSTTKNFISKYKNVLLLESFFYAKDWMAPVFKNNRIMIDSGAFSFMQGTDISNVDWDQYVERYAKFINEHKIDLFIELDIDSIVGLEEVERLRRKLERLTGKKCIPVWHRSRGRDYWLKMIDEYEYVALGGVVSGKGTKEAKQYISLFPWFLQQARKKNTKVHILGFTTIPLLKKYRPHSVDSTAWIYGNRGGFLYKFSGGELLKINKPKNSRLRSSKVLEHNFNEWVKFQEYAERYL